MSFGTYGKLVASGPAGHGARLKSSGSAPAPFRDGATGDGGSTEEVFQVPTIGHSENNESSEFNLRSEERAGPIRCEASGNYADAVSDSEVHRLQQGA